MLTHASTWTTSTTDLERSIQGTRTSHLPAEPARRAPAHAAPGSRRRREASPRPTDAAWRSVQRVGWAAWGNAHTATPALRAHAWQRVPSAPCGQGGAAHVAARARLHARERQGIHECTATPARAAAATAGVSRPDVSTRQLANLGSSRQASRTPAARRGGGASVPRRAELRDGTDARVP